MSATDRTGIRLQDATINVNGRTVYPTSFSFEKSRNRAVQDVIGAQVVTKSGNGGKTWSMDAILTEEDYKTLNALSNNEGSFEVSGRIPTGNGGFTNILLTGCQLDSDSQSFQGDGNSTITLGGTYKERKIS